METGSLNDVENDFADAFSTFRRSAFRLEWLQNYQNEEEQKLLQVFLKEGPSKSRPSEFNDWCAEIANGRANGKLFQRVRRVEFPLTEYTRFEISDGYRFSVEVGEDVRVLEGSHTNLNLPNHENEVKDFWIFDDNLCFELEYDHQGCFVAVHKVEGTRLLFNITLKAKALAASVELKKSESWRRIWTRQMA